MSSSPTFPTVLVFLALLGAGPACDGGGSTADVCGAPLPGAVWARYGFDAAAQSPFPTDRYTQPDLSRPTGLRLALPEDGVGVLLPGLTMIGTPPIEMIEALNQYDGFSVRASVLVPLSGAVDPASLPRSPAESVSPDSTVRLLHLGQATGGAPYGDAVEVTVEYVDPNGDHLLLITPSLPLSPGTRYGVVVTRGVLAAGEGAPLEPSADFKISAGICPASGSSADPGLIAAEQARMTILSEPAVGVDLTTVAVATVFTTQSVDTDLEVVAAQIADDTAPVASFDPDGDGQADVYLPDEVPGGPTDIPRVASLDRVVRGVFEVPEYRDEAGVVARAADGTPQPFGTYTLPFLLTLPADPALQPYPVVIIQTGVSTVKEYVLNVSGYLAEQGLASIAIDLADQGEGPTRGSLFFNPLSLPATHGNVLQSTADLMVLLRLIREDLGSVDFAPGGVGDGAVDLDVSWIGYLASSAGGMTGILLLARDPTVDTAAIAVSGAGYEHLVRHWLTGVFDERDLIAYTVIAQTILDRVDPANQTPWLLQGAGADVQILLLQATEDIVMAPPATRELARRLHLPLLQPYQIPIEGLQTAPTPATGRGLFQYELVKHGFIFKDDTHPALTDAARRQMTHFLSTSHATGQAEIIDPTP